MAKNVDKNVDNADNLEDSELVANLAKLIDSSEQEFRAFVGKQNLGFIKGLQILFENTYLSLANISKKVDKQMGNKRISKESYDTLDNLHAETAAEMIKIEVKQAILIEIENAIMASRNVVTADTNN